MRLPHDPSARLIDVLICDDDEAIRRLLRAVVAQRPSMRVVGEAADGIHAITEAARLQPDVIVLDLAMPRRTGLDAIVELRQVAPQAKIIVFSGFSMAAIADRAIELGAVLFLSKGADPEAINDAIEQAAAIGHRTRARPADARGRRRSRAAECGMVSVDSLPHTKPHVLVVEDDRAVGSFVLTVLASGGYDATLASGKEEALTAIREHRIDLVVTDLVLGNSDGHDIRESLRAMQPGIPVIFMSGYGRTAYGAMADDPVLGKPFTAAQLLERVERELSVQ